MIDRLGRNMNVRTRKLTVHLTNMIGMIGMRSIAGRISMIMVILIVIVTMIMIKIRTKIRRKIRTNINKGIEIIGLIELINLIDLIDLIDTIDIRDKINNMKNIIITNSANTKLCLKNTENSAYILNLIITISIHYCVHSLINNIFLLTDKNYKIIAYNIILFQT